MSGSEGGSEGDNSLPNDSLPDPKSDRSGGALVAPTVTK